MKAISTRLTAISGAYFVVAVRGGAAGHPLRTRGTARVPRVPPPTALARRRRQEWLAGDDHELRADLPGPAGQRDRLLRSRVPALRYPRERRPAGRSHGSDVRRLHPLLRTA